MGKPEPPEPFSAPHWRVISFVLGATGLLNLVQDVGRLAVHGKLKAWLDAYALVVSTAFGFLFGWIDFFWISISPLEHHILVLTSLFALAMWRADYHFNRYIVGQPHSSASANAPIRAVAFLVVMFLFLLALPDPWGVFLASALFLLLSIGALTHNTPLEHPTGAPVQFVFGRGRSVAYELVGIAMVFAVLLALNYSLFRTDGG